MPIPRPDTESPVEQDPSASLKVVGFWTDFRSQHPSRYRYPHPEELVDPGWESENRAKIVKYLQSGHLYLEYLGYSYCRFQNGPSDKEMGDKEFTDGVWLWPEGLSVYVDKYAVRLPDAFISHMKENDFAVPSEIKRPLPRKMSAVLWIQWCKENCPVFSAAYRRENRLNRLEEILLRGSKNKYAKLPFVLARTALHWMSLSLRSTNKNKRGGRPKVHAP